MTTLFVFQSDLIGGINLGCPPIAPGGKAWFSNIGQFDGTNLEIKFENMGDHTNYTERIPVNNTSLNINLSVGKYLASFNVPNQGPQFMHFSVSDKGASDVFFTYFQGLFYPELKPKFKMINIDTTETHNLEVQISLNNQYLKHGRSTKFFSGRVYTDIKLVGTGLYELNVHQENLDNASQKSCASRADISPWRGDEIGGGTTIIIQEPPSPWGMSGKSS